MDRRSPDHRLERLTQLPAHDNHTIRIAVEPTTGFHERTTDAVRSRVDDLERLGVLIGLLGLGPRTASSLIDPDNESSDHSFVRDLGLRPAS